MKNILLLLGTLLTISDSLVGQGMIVFPPDSVNPEIISQWEDVGGLDLKTFNVSGNVTDIPTYCFDYIESVFDIEKLQFYSNVKRKLELSDSYSKDARRELGFVAINSDYVIISMHYRNSAVGGVRFWIFENNSRNSMVSSHICVMGSFNGSSWKAFRRMIKRHSHFIVNLSF